MEIINPKVFISYAWTSEEYSNKVLEFVKRLLDNGIDVLFDKFEMKPGKELNNFMEQSVKDETVTHVLMLLNTNYAERADNRKGGVGTETQIISNVVYENLDQTKFLPVIFESKLEDISKCKPVFLKSRIHIDLSNVDSYEREFKNLIKLLYGKSEFQKPEIGIRPSWVDQEHVITDNIYALKSKMTKNDKISRLELREELNNNIKLMLNDDYFQNDKSWDIENIPNTLIYMRRYRNDFVEIMNLTSELEESYLDFHGLFQNLKDEAFYKFTSNSNLSRVILNFFDFFIHELYIYYIAILYKKSLYDDIGLFTRLPYISQQRYGEGANPLNFKKYIYDYGLINDVIQKYMDNREKRKHHSGKATFWKEGIYDEFLTVKDLAFADVILTNLSISYSNKKDWVWFATMYIYEFAFTSKEIEKISISLKSKSLSKKYYEMFNFNTQEDVKNVIEKSSFNKLDRNLGYNSSFDQIPILSDFIKPEEVETYD